MLCHRSQGKSVPRITEWFTTLTSAKKTHKVSTESVTRFSDLKVPMDSSQTYYGGSQISELKSMGGKWKMETASTGNALEKFVHEGARRN